MGHYQVLRLVIFHLSFSIIFFLHNVEGRMSALSVENLERSDVNLNSSKMVAVKSIQTIHGDIYDCVDLHKQPAFDHPLLKDHKIQMRPSFVPQTDVSNATINGLTGVSINVELEVSCPSGSVPIRRITKEERIRAKASFRKHFQGSYPGNDGGPERFIFAGIATAQKPATVYHGVAGFITISNPTAGRGQFSASVISIEAGPPEQFGVIRIGWMVNMDLYKDNRTRLYTIWGQGINGQMHGCYNTYCSGFVQTNPKIPLDKVLEPVSIVRGPQYYVKLAVTQDKSTGNWLLRYGESGEDVGYWPSKLFINLKDSADALRWGGMVYSSAPRVPQMGNGDNGEIHSSKFMRVALTYESQPSLNGTVDVPIEVWKTKCYKAGDNSYKGEYWGYSFYFGGEGGDVSRCSN